MKTTPEILRGSIAAIAASALLFAGAAAWSVREHQHALKTVAKDSAPSIIAAQRLKAAMSDLDASVANELLGAPAAAAAKAYSARRREIGDALVIASENVTFGDAERIPLQTIATGISLYERSAQRARDLRAGDPAQALAAYREATMTMEKTLLPAATALDAANRQELDKGYSGLKTASVVSQIAVLFTGALLIGVLAWTQMFLARRTRRAINLMLLGATLLSAVFLLVLNISLLSASHQLKIVKEDAFESIHSLWQATAISYDANADESRYLLDPGRADVYERAFVSKSALLASIPAGQTAEGVLAASRRKEPPSGFKGLLADEIRNITFEGEYDAAAESLQTWDAYLRVDARIRDLQRQGRSKDAILLCVGDKPGESNYVFEQFDAALKKTLDVNQKAFEQAAEKGFQRLNGLTAIAGVAALLAAVLGYFGILPRLREYSA